MHCKPFDRAEAVSGPFIGTEAVSARLLGKHHLRTRRYTALFPGVYLPTHRDPTFADRVEAAWLWSHRRGVVIGLTAARMYGAQWLPDDLPIQLAWPNARPPQGISTSDLTLHLGETVTLGGIPVTSLARTAFDLARRRPLWKAVETLDALGAAAPFTPADVLAVAEKHRGVRGLRQIPQALALHDPGAQSPKETWLRVLVVRSGYPPPQTQILVLADGRQYYLDMGWPDLRIAIEYDGDHHRTDQAQFTKDIVRLEDLAALGWTVIRIAAGTRPEEVLARLRRAWP